MTRRAVERPDRARRRQRRIRLLDLVIKGWQYVLRLAAEPSRLPWLLAKIVLVRAHPRELLALHENRGALRPAPRTVIDVGANVGQFSSAASAMYPGCRIIAFEPIPACVARLEARMRHHRGGFEATAIAITSRSGNATLTINRNSESSSLLPLSSNHTTSFPWAQPVDELEVDTSTLDEVMSARGLAEDERPILLKIDVQGAELDVLAGARQTLATIAYILVEAPLVTLYEGGSTFAEIHRELSSHGFVYAGATDQLRGAPGAPAMQQDALFVRSEARP